MKTLVEEPRNECKACGKPIAVTLKLCSACKYRAYRKTDKRRAYKRAYMKAYEKTDKRRAYKRAYRKTEKHKAYMKAYMKAYYQNVTKPKREEMKKETKE